MFVELSFPLYEGAPACFFNTVQNKIIPVLRIADGDVLNTTELRLSTHNGTHMDAPMLIHPIIGIKALQVPPFLG